MLEQDGQPQRAASDDLDSVLDLLVRVDLPTEGVIGNFHNFIVWYAPGTLEVKGCIGLEVYGSDAVLRSVAVHPEYQGKGVGVGLLQKAIEYARSIQLDRLYLLTDTAEKYFLKHGFEYIDRTIVPQRIGKSIEFTTLCPSTSSLY
ncbi:MAG: GNAT family N-acetyltransferase [Candidatus Thorarchaeota archaeon]